MAGPSFQALPGFRDFIPRECAIRNYLFETWRSVARRCGYVEYESPILEDTGLYLKKSGGELSAQLFRLGETLFQVAIASHLRDLFPLHQNRTVCQDAVFLIGYVCK